MGKANLMQQSVLPFQPTRRAFLGAVLAFGVSGEAMALTSAQRVVRAARRQVGVTLTYDPAYSVLRFPNGDVDRAKGVCTDVVIRAFRDALGADLQALVNADMRANFGAYPKNWGWGAPTATSTIAACPIS